MTTTVLMKYRFLDRRVVEAALEYDKKLLVENKYLTGILWRK
jgi:hypothetical protein